MNLCAATSLFSFSLSELLHWRYLHLQLPTAQFHFGSFQLFLQLQFGVDFAGHICVKQFRNHCLVLKDQKLLHQPQGYSFNLCNR